ncbi:telomere length regulation protein TEL2 homolog isoform X2 [Microcaecilia unicolor]|uniref:Telomere length regulation protein TEL2 homolog n=1 Tax=Microcaecilia unicolor TaxID=1415580 RepID=A0A6P7YUR9_9AMPH|nr:telomere length regulation protein TEL2 homolog isoform X2 [Microcaecilia unicolor]
MEPECHQVCYAVKDAMDVLFSSSSGVQIAAVLKTMKQYLGQGGISTTLREREEFSRIHFSPFLRCLIAKVIPDRLELLTLEQQELLESFFLEGPPDQTFLVLLDCIMCTEPSFCLMKIVGILENFLCKGRLAALMWEVCQQQAQVTSPLLQETLLSKIVCLPDHLSNKLHEENLSAFYPQNYFPLLGREIVFVLQKISEALRDGKNCSISFVSQVLGKVCLQGRREEVLSVVLPRLTAFTQLDCIWQRMCWRLVESVPDRWMEAVVSGFVQMAPGAVVLCRLLGNLVMKNKKAQFVLTQKMLLLQYGYKTTVLQSLLGYLALDSSRRPLLMQVLKELLETWGSSSAVKHSPIEQQLYISKAILICLCHLKEEELESHKQELLSYLMAGVQCHLDSNLLQVRRLGMIVAEGISSCISLDGSCLKFQYEEDEQSRELLSLLTPAVQTVNPQPPKNGTDSRLCHTSGAASPVDMEVRPTAQDLESDSELDSDDELVPYDMSEDKELKKTKAPVYIRDCIEVLTGSEDVEKLEATLGVLKGLILKNQAMTKEVSVELVKVLLHLEDKSNLECFTELRHGAMVAVTVTDPISVSQYLSAQFYSMNYSLRQRMDILDVLAIAAQELSQPKAPSSQGPAVQTLSKQVKSDPDSGISKDWKKIVQERIESKTRRFAKGASRPDPEPIPNRYNSVAGYFFFPLIRNFDRPLATFDLLGDDRLVLGRLLHTLGILIYCALHTMVAAQMGKALLELVWSLRFHTDPYVRQSLLFCISTTLLSVPSERLLTDMADELLEMQSWLADVAEKDPDVDCRKLSLQSLLLMENLKKKINPDSPV